MGYLMSSLNDGKCFFVMGTAPDSGKSTIGKDVYKRQAFLSLFILNSEENYEGKNTEKSDYGYDEETNSEKMGWSCNASNGAGGKNAVWNKAFYISGRSG